MLATLKGKKGISRAKLVRTFRNPSPQMVAKLCDLKADARQYLRKRDPLWHLLLEAMATLGNSRGYDSLIADPNNYRRVTYHALARLTARKRKLRLEQTFRAAAVRMPLRKAEWLAKNFELLRRMGGPAAAWRLALSQAGREAKIAFVKQFHGIGDKYARNIWMTLHHPEFRDCIALDIRVQSISAALGVRFLNYAEHESFYQQLARDAGRTTWEVDRLIYWFRDDIFRQVEQVDLPRDG